MPLPLAPDGVGIIGLGAFGSLLASALAQHLDVVAFDVRGNEPPTGVSAGSIDDACARGVVVPAVNVQQLGAVLDQIAPRLREGALVADVCSVKAGPIAMMLDRLPAGVRVLGTHPLFGPQSVAELGLKGQRIALCPARIDPPALGAVRAFLTDRLGLMAIEVGADEHDRQMAEVQALTHLVGHAVRALGLGDRAQGEPALGTLAHRRLVQLANNIAGDSPELFEAIQRHNPHAASIRARFAEAVEAVRRRAGDAV